MIHNRHHFEQYMEEDTKWKSEILARLAMEFPGYYLENSI